MNQRARILYIEDNPENLLLVKRVLEQRGYSVIGAEDGLSGIKMAQEEFPDLILMDINVAGLDGLEATTKLKGLPSLAKTPIVALTARVMKGDRERALAAGCDGYIPKPIDVDRFPAQVESFLQGKRERVKKDEERGWLKEYSRRLVDRLQEKVEELKRINKELERKVEERTRELREAKDYLNNLIENSLDAIVAVDVEGKVTMWNRGAELIYGYSPEEVMGKRVDFLFDLSRIDKGLEVTRRRKDGGVVRTISTSSPIRNADGDQVGISIIEKDITETIKLREKLLESEKLAGITETAVALNHEINNPLTVIMGQAQMLLEGGQDFSPQARERLQVVERESRRIKTITERLTKIVEPISTSYSQGVKMIDVQSSKVNGDG